MMISRLPNSLHSVVTKSKRINNYHYGDSRNIPPSSKTSSNRIFLTTRTIGYDAIKSRSYATETLLTVKQHNFVCQNETRHSNGQQQKRISSTLVPIVEFIPNSYSSRKHDINMQLQHYTMKEQRSESSSLAHVGRVQRHRCQQQNLKEVQHKQQQMAVRLLMDTLIASQCFLPNHRHPTNHSHSVHIQPNFHSKNTVSLFFEKASNKTASTWLNYFDDLGNTDVDDSTSDTIWGIGNYTTTNVVDIVLSEHIRKDTKVHLVDPNDNDVVDVLSESIKSDEITHEMQSNDIDEWRDIIRQKLLTSIRQKNYKSGLEALKRAIHFQKNPYFYVKNHNNNFVHHGRLHTMKPNITATNAIPNIDIHFININLVHQLFHIIPNEQPFDLYQTLLYYHQIMDNCNHEDSITAAAETTTTETENDLSDKERTKYMKEIPGMYYRLCRSIQHIDPMLHSYGDSQNLIRSILHDIKIKLCHHNEREKCYPALINSLVNQRSIPLADAFTLPIYQHMIDMNYHIPDHWYEHILQHSKYYRQHLPYGDILYAAVFDKNRRPNPSIVLMVIDNLFPYTKDTQAVKKAIQAVVELQRQSINLLKEREQKQQSEHAPQPCDSKKIKQKKPERLYEYKLDIGVLEAIGYAAANQGDIELNTLLWDLMDLYQCKEPTLAFYENTAHAFSCYRETYYQAFRMLIEIEHKFNNDLHMKTIIDTDSDDTIPSRAVIRGMSTNIRVSRENVFEAKKQIDVLYQNGLPITVSCLNVVLSCLAERGDSDSSFHMLLFDFDKYDVKPNADSFCFVLESLGKHVLRATRLSSADDTKAHCIRQAEKLLNLMEQHSVSLTQHIIYEYTELLCQTDQFATASDVVLDTYQEFGYVNSKIIYRVAMANSRLGNHDMAYKIASLADIDIPRLLQNLNANEAIDKRKKPPPHELD